MSGPRTVRSSSPIPSGAREAKSSRCSLLNSFRIGRSPAIVARTSVGRSVAFNAPEHTRPPGSASTSTRKFSDRRSLPGSSPGTTGRSLTTESSPLPWMRRARTTRPARSSARSGVSKKATMRICASSGSMPRAIAVERCWSSPTVSFSSTLSESFMSDSASATCSSESRGAVVVGAVIGPPGRGGQGARRASPRPRPRPRAHARRRPVVPPPQAAGARRTGGSGDAGQAGGDRETEHRRKAGRALRLPRAPRGHRVDQHHEQRAGREAVDGRPDVAGRGVRDREADPRGEGAHGGDDEPQQPHRSPRTPGGDEVVGRADRLRQVRDEDRDEQPDPDALARGDADPEHELLGDAVEERAQRQRDARARVVPARAGPRLEERVEAEVRQRPGGEADGDGPRSADLSALLGEIEAHRADQRAGAEGEHEPDETARPRSRPTEEAPDDEGRRGQRAPSERGRHLTGSSGNASSSARYRRRAPSPGGSYGGAFSPDCPRARRSSRRSCPG